MVPSPLLRFAREGAVEAPPERPRSGGGMTIPPFVDLAAWLAVTRLRQDKRKLSATTDLLLQKFFLDDQLVTVANFGLESTYARRAPIDNLPPGYEWSTDPEMELELKAGVGVVYRFAPRWYAGFETFYVTEFETEVGQERWSWHAGPSLHFEDRHWSATLTWMPQLRGGGETYPGQTDTDLHLIEKTKQELRLKIGYNF